MTIATISPAEARRIAEVGARIVDIRDTDEHAREHIPGSVNMPLTRIDALTMCDTPVIFHCRSGMRTAGNADVLAGVAQGISCYIVEGGIDAWRKAGLPVISDRKQPLEVMRAIGDRNAHPARRGARIAGVAHLPCAFRFRRRWPCDGRCDRLVRNGELAAAYAVEPALDDCLKREDG